MSSSKSTDLQALDQLTGGVFSAATSGERSARLREWLQTQPALEVMNEVFQELSARDRGAAKALRERIDEVRRARQQESVAAEWAARAETLLQTARLNIADAMAWQRDAAKAGAPLSREPLASLKTRLAERIRAIEDLQHQIMVQREAAVLLTQRIDVLSTRPLSEAQAAHESLAADVQHWMDQQQGLQADTVWPSVDLKYPPQIEAASLQLRAVWEAFGAALVAARTAWDDAQAALPPVPVWADDIRRHRGHATAAEPVPEAAGAPAGAPAQRPAKMDAAQRQALRQQATQAVLEVLEGVEKEVAEGHGKASAGAAASLRQVLKVHGRHLDTALDARVHAALTAAGELEGWQRWRADQIRQELVAKAEALMKVVMPEPASAAAPAGEASSEGEAAAASAQTAGAAADADVQSLSRPADDSQPVSGPVSGSVSEPRSEPVATSEPSASEPSASEPAASEPAASEPAASEEAPSHGAPSVAKADKAGKPGKAARRPAASAVHKVPTLSGRKMQEALRELREAWKQTDQGGLPNHTLWRRFDAACNEAYTVVQAWLDEVRQSSAAQKAQRSALLDEVRAWTAAHAQDSDWRSQIRALHQFGERWRNAGHMSEKAYAEMQAQWKKVIREAGARLEQAQKASMAQRQTLIAEAQALAAQPLLRVDAVKALQQRWQHEAQAVPLDRRTEQKLWETFRAPIDEAFQRKGSERQQASQALSARDRAVLDASKALDAANAEGDAHKIRAAMAALDAALRAQAEPVPAVPVTAASGASASAAAPSDQTPGETPARLAPAASAAASMPAEPAPEPGAQDGAGEPAPSVPEQPAVAPARPVRAVVAVRGDDRPGQKRTEAPAAGGRRDGKGPGMGRGAERGGERSRGDWADRGPRRDDRAGQRDDRGPRLSDAAFRAQREARERAEQALRKLAAQAHGETLTQLLQAWQTRQPGQLPTAQSFGRAVSAPTRQAWLQALSAPAGANAATALLRLEMAADAPTPAEHLSERRMLQLQLLTRRNEPGPRETWGHDVGTVLAGPYSETDARRLQNVLRQLLRA